VLAVRRWVRSVIILSLTQNLEMGEVKANRHLIELYKRLPLSCENHNSYRYL